MPPPRQLMPEFAFTMLLSREEAKDAKGIRANPSGT